jgi:hypothetical protein
MFEHLIEFYSAQAKATIQHAKDNETGVMRHAYFLHAEWMLNKATHYTKLQVIRWGLDA